MSKNSLDLIYIAQMSRSFTRLMRKRFLINSDELQLEWRPLYDTYKRLLYSETENLGLRYLPDNLESNLNQVIRLSRPHFPNNATQEMLDEWRPMLCPYSVYVQRVVTYMHLFLPTTLPPEHHDKGFKLWFDEILQLWLDGKIPSVCHDNKLACLLCRLAADCLGYIDWEPYMARIFNHFKSNFILNNEIARHNLRRCHTESVDVGPCVQWMVYMISQSNGCLEHIEKLFNAIKSFYHPSNTDRRWHSRLQQFLYKLPACYVKRLYRERYKPSIWSKRIPETYKLTDEQTTKFVKIMLPVVLTSMFNQSAINPASMAFRDLAALRPELVVPPLLERLYGSYETLIEPHRLLSSINCVNAVVGPMVRPCKFFPEGPSHVVPLLLNSLPGIDSNDMRKCMAVFKFIATIAAHVQLRDYSYLVDERPDLTLEQQQLCLSTSQFEDFVVQLLDKCFILIENTATSSIANLDQEKQLRSGEEGFIEASISSVGMSILAQSSPEIRLAALDKLYSHVTRHIFDTKTQGKAIATLCLACAKTTPKETLAKFLPHFGRLILTLTENEEVFQESILDDELLFSLLLVSEIVRCNSAHILDHKDIIIDVLNRALKLTAKEGYQLGCAILRHLLRALTNISFREWSNIDHDDPEVQETMRKWPFDNWGHTTDLKNSNLKWVLPKEDSIEFARQVLESFLRKAVRDLSEWSKRQKELSREEVHRCLFIILSGLIGAASVLPGIISEEIDLCPYEVPMRLLCIKNTGTEPLNFADGTNIRTWIIEAMKQVLERVIGEREDDTKSLVTICEIFNTAVSYFGYNNSEFQIASKRIKCMKVGAQNRLQGSKRHVRFFLAEKVSQQHRAMLLNKVQPDFTKLHLDVIKCLFTLSQSHYVEVRNIAQDTIYMIINYFPFSESVLLPMLVSELKQETVEDNKLRGLLNLAAGRRMFPSIAIDSNWSTLKVLWPALILSPHSEKPDIVKLLDRICGIVQRSFDTFDLQYSWPEQLQPIASKMWTDGSIDTSVHQQPEQELVSRARAAVAERNKQRVLDYQELVLRLTALMEDPRLHWHRKMVAGIMFSHLTREDQPLPLASLKFCLDSLVNERIAVRTKAINLVATQLKLHKRKHAKRTITFSNDDAPTESSQAVLGDKTNLDDDACLSKQPGDEDVEMRTTDQSNKCDSSVNSNKWLQYRLTDVDYTREQWDRLVFIDKPHIGFYRWPKELEVYEPYEQQPQLNRRRDDLDAFEALVFDRFMCPDFVEKLVEYFCFEENKGNSEQHRFDTKRPALFKSLFRNYGPCMLKPFEKYVLEYVKSDCDQKQRFVIELLAGMIRGSKHWSYDMMCDLRSFVLPILDRLPVTQENFKDWIGFTNYVFRSRDKRRFNWLLNYVITKAISATESSVPSVTPFIQGCRLTMAHYAMIQCDWRAVDHVFPRVIQELRPQEQLLAYANLRNCLASIYSLIYMFDDPDAPTTIPGTLSDGPKRAEFIEYLQSRLAILEKNKNSSPGMSKSASSNQLAGKAIADVNAMHRAALSATIAATQQQLRADEPIAAQVADIVGSVRHVAAVDGSASAKPSSAAASSLVRHLFANESPGKPATGLSKALLSGGGGGPCDNLPDVSFVAKCLADMRASDDTSSLQGSPTRDGVQAILAANLASASKSASAGPSLSSSVVSAGGVGVGGGVGGASGSNSGGLSTPTAQARIKSETQAPDSPERNAAVALLEALRQTIPNLPVPPGAIDRSGATDSSSEMSQERKDAIKLMKLTTFWIIYNVCRMKSPIPVDFFKLLPVICDTGCELNDHELSSSSLAAMAVLGGSYLTDEAIGELLTCVRKIIAEHSWHARVATAALIEIMISANLFNLIKSDRWRDEIEDIVINHLICDERIEVREASSPTLSGMIHCEFTRLTPKLLAKFKQRANEPLCKRKQPNGATVIEPKNIITRHSGILCLCACVDAHPYSVPDYLPDILTFLSDHLTDPQPISVSNHQLVSDSI